MPQPLCLCERAPDTHLVRGWVGPRACLDAVAKGRNPCSCRLSNPSRPAHSLITILTEHSFCIKKTLTNLKFKCKVKLKLSLCFNWAPRHEGVLGEWGYNSTHSLTSALDGGEWLASLPGRFTPREKAPGTLWIGGWVGPTAVLNTVVKRKIPSPLRQSNPRTPIVQPVAQRYTNWAITARKFKYM
jgi:hypothetical protein